jgi:hypothetical protein
MRTRVAMVCAAVSVLSIAGNLSSNFRAAAQMPTPQSIEQRLEAQFVLTKATADNSDIVTAGAILVLKKDGLLMSWTKAAPATNTYKDGKISHGAWGLVARPGFRRLMNQDQASQSRLFVTGEKFWVIGISIHDDGIVFDLLSDPMGDYRYHATLKFPFQKGVYPSEDQAQAIVGEVLGIVPPDNGQQTAAAPPAAPPSAPPAAPPAGDQTAPPSGMAPIPPPPPPSDAPPAAPKTITLKETKAQVLADFGPPTKVVQLGDKEIDYYPDMKVTYVNGKVTDVQ